VPLEVMKVRESRENAGTSGVCPRAQPWCLVFDDGDRGRWNASPGFCSSGETWVTMTIAGVNVVHAGCSVRQDKR